MTKNTDSPRILLLITALGLGGAEQIVYDLALGLRKKEWRVEVVALDGRGEMALRLESAGISVVDLGARSVLGVLAVWRLREFLRLRKREGSKVILHAHLFHANIAGRLAAWGLAIPVISTCHIVERRFRPWQFLLNRITARLSVREVCVSSAVARFEEEKTGLPEIFFTVIPNGVNLARFADLPASLELRRQLGLGESNLVIGYFGRFSRQKGCDLFLEAIDLLPPSDIQFVLAGYGEEEARLRKRAGQMANRHRILFLDPAPPQRILPAFDICVMPSRYEGFGLVAVEAMACGCALIASDADSLPEVIGSAGVLLPAGSPSRLAAALSELAANPQRRIELSTKGRERAGEYSCERMVDSYDSLYRTVLSGT